MPSNLIHRAGASACLLCCAGMLVSCKPAEPLKKDAVPIAVSADADPILHAEDGAHYLDSTIADALHLQMCIPYALDWYDTADGVVQFCDPSGVNRMTLEYRSGDDMKRCRDAYLHDIGTKLPENRIRSYDLQTIGESALNAYRIDARELVQDQPEHLISYWFLEPAHASGQYHGCYIVTVDTIAENLDVMMRCIPSFVLPEDFRPNAAGEELAL